MKVLVYGGGAVGPIVLRHQKTLVCKNRWLLVIDLLIRQQNKDELYLWKQKTLKRQAASRLLR
jgi:hypothetical protein